MKRCGHATDGVNARTLIGFYDIGIVLAIYCAVSYGAVGTRVLAVTGGIRQRTVTELLGGLLAAVVPARRAARLPVAEGPAPAPSGACAGSMTMGYRSQPGCPILMTG